MEIAKKPTKILIVDDERDIVEILSYNLAKENYEIFKAYDGKEAVSSARINHPDVVIMDVRMPELSGIEACRIMKNDSALKDTMILILTADDDEYVALRAGEVGCDQYITKPVPPSFIVGMVKKLILRHNEISS